MPNNTFITVDQFDSILSEVTKKISDTYTRNDSNVRTKTIFIFKYSDGLPEVMPSWVNWDTITDIVTIDGSSGWSLDLNAYEEDLDSHRYLWMSSTNINSLSQDNIYWSAPVRLSGERGPAGVDGTLIEYIYKLTPNSDSIITTPSRSNWKQEGWTDHPSGITLQYQAEWVSTRKKETVEQDWSDWSTPALWSKYGVNGLDGDGYEYIYYRNNGENRPNIPSYNINSQDYQTDEYVPLGWTDDPQDVTESQRYLWMSSRKKENGRWGDFKEATMWAKYGEQGEVGYINKKMYYKGDLSGTPPYKPTVVNPSGWTSVMPSYIPGDYVWMIEAYFNSKNEFVDVDGPDGQLTKGWSNPILVSGIKGNSGEKGEKGEKGEIGPVGDKGASGLPGSDMLYRYSLGDEEKPLATNDEEWQYTTAGLHPTEEYPYIWAQLGRKSYSFVETEDGEPTLEEHITWEGEPFKLTGMPGENGAGGQIIYPAGVYSTDAEYTTNDKTAPYVYFDNEYYVLNIPGTWCAKKKQSPTGEEIPITFTPLDDIGEFGTKSWVKFESFSAIHAQIGIIENGLIGSAVFNGDYMFSQYGLYNGTEMEGLNDAEIRRCFEKFDPHSPYSEDAIFKPNTCFNFKTGKVWLNAGKTTFNIDGSGQLAGGQITWKKNGDIEFGPGVKVAWQQVDGGDNKLEELRESLENKIKDAGGLSTSDLDEAKELLKSDYQSKIDNLKALLEQSDDHTKELLQANIDALTREQDKIHTTIESLRNSLGDIEDGLEGALTEEQINEIIQAGLINDTFWTEDTIGSETVLGRKIVGLIATFGSVDAENITGNTIKGKTVRSLDDVTLIDGTTGPKWELNNDGSGHLANGRISWGSNGAVELKGVTIDWSDVNKPNGSGSDSDSGSNTNISSKFKSMVFKRSNDDLSQISLTGGSWSDPKPNESGWTDHITSEAGAIWQSTCTFTLNSDGTSTSSGWSSPAQLSDSSTIEIAYGKESVKDQNNIYSGLPTSGGKANPTGNYTEGWVKDPSDEEEYWYIATAKAENDVWGEWHVDKIKGEKGTDGTSISIKGDKASESDLPIPPDNVNDSYIIGNDLYVWVPDNNSWSNVGPFRGKDGEPGVTYYLHIKYATDVQFNGDDVTSVTLTESDGENAFNAKWIGVGHSTNPSDPIDTNSLKTVYKWSEFLTSSNVSDIVRSSLGDFHITSNHIAGKTMDNDVYDTGSTQYVPLAKDTEFIKFNKDANGRDLDGKYTTHTSNGVDGDDDSMGPSWQIRNDGAGHFASGNIRWNKDGELSAKINGSFDGGSDGSLAGGALTWDNEKVYVHKGFQFDDNVGISWDNLSGEIPDNIATKDYVDQNSGGFTTEIGNNWIKTADVTCEKLKVQNLQTKSSSETGNKNNIVATSNTLNAYNTKSQPALTITGNSFSRIQPRKEQAIASGSNFSGTTAGGASTNKDIFTWTVSSTMSDAKIIVPDVKVEPFMVINGTSTATCSLSVNWYYEVYQNSTLYADKYECGGGASGSASGSLSGGQSGENIYGNTVTIPGFSISVDPGYTYKVKFYTSYSAQLPSGVYTVQVNTYFEEPLNITSVYGIDRTDIGENGFRVCHDSSHIVEFAEYNNSGSYMIYSDNYGIKISDTAMFLKLANQWYRTGVKNISGTGNVLTLTSVTEDSVFDNDSNIEDDSGSDTGYGSYGNTAAIWEDEEITD